MKTPTPSEIELISAHDFHTSDSQVYPNYDDNFYETKNYPNFNGFSDH